MMSPTIAASPKFKGGDRAHSPHGPGRINWLPPAAEVIGVMSVLAAPGALALWTWRQMESQAASVSGQTIGGRDVVESALRSAIFESWTQFLIGLGFMNLACLFGVLLILLARARRSRAHAAIGVARVSPSGRRAWLITTLVGVVCVLAPSASTIVASRVVMGDSFLSGIVQRNTSMDVKSAVIGTASEVSAHTMLIGSVATGIVGLIVFVQWFLLLGPRRPLPDSSDPA